jgi:hypothetical protein
MLSAPGSDFWEGPKRPGAIGDAIFGNNFFPSYPHTPPLSTSDEGGIRFFFSETASTAAARWSTLPLEVQACRIQAVLALALRGGRGR